MTFIRKIINSLLCLLLVCVLVIGYLYYSQTGISLLIAFFKPQLGPNITFQQVTGSLAHGIHIRQFAYQDKQTSISLEKVYLNVSLWDLIAHQQFAINTLVINTAKIKSHASSAKKQQTLKLPNLKLRYLLVKQLSVSVAKQHFEFQQLSVGGNISQHHLNLRLHWQTLTSLQQTHPIISHAANLTLDGSQANYQLHIASQLTIDHYQINDIAISASVTKQQIDIKQFTGQFEHSLFHGHAQLKNTAHHWLLNAKLNLAKLALAKLNQALKGKLNAKLTLNGKFSNKQRQLHLTVAGTIGQQPLKGQLHFQQAQKQVAQMNSQWQLGDASIDINALKKNQWQLHWQATIPRLQRFIEQAQGTLNSQGNVIFKAKKTTLTAQIKGQHLAYQTFSLQHATATIKLTPAQQLSVKLILQQLHRPHLSINEIRLDAQGNRLKQTINANIKAANQSLNFILNSHWQHQQWQANLQQINWLDNKHQQWHLQKPSKLIISSKKITLPTTCINHQQQTICWQFNKAHPQQWALRANITKLPINRLLPTQFSSQATVTLALALTQHQHTYAGTLTSQLTPGELHYHYANHHYRIPIQQAQLKAQLSAQGFLTQLNIKLANQDEIHGDFSLPDYDGNGLPNGHQSIAGKLTAQVKHLNFIPLLLPDIQTLDGNLQTKMNFDGTLSHPKVQGQLTLQATQASIPRLNLTLNAISAHLSLLNNNHFKLEAKLSSQHPLTINGQGQWQHQRIQGQFTIKGQHVLVSDLTQIYIIASPNLTLNIDNNQLALSGSVNIPEARINPNHFDSSVEQADDIVIVNQVHKTTPSPYLLTSKIKLSLGPKVYLHYDGIYAHLGGALSIMDAPNTITTAVGTLRALSGKYSAYGQVLTLQHGRLLFTGGDITNPGLDIQAIKTIHTVAGSNLFNLTNQSINNSAIFISQTPTLIIGVNVQHTLKKPMLSFFSKPAGLSQADILSYLLIGRPASQTSQADRQVLFSAVSALNINQQSIGSVSEKLKNALGLNELGVESESEFDSDNNLIENTSLVLGKYLTPRLYINYSIGLLQEINTFRVRYTLSKRWIVQAETNNLGRGADLFYSIQH